MSKTTNDYVMNPTEGEKYLERMCHNAEKHGIQIMFIVAKYASPNAFVGCHTKYGSKYRTELTHAIYDEIDKHDLDEWTRCCWREIDE